MRHSFQLVCASIPRSGHHFLAHIMESALQSRLRYCERYDVHGCCNVIPCLKQAPGQLILLKCHDFENELDPQRRDVQFVVQYRNAVEAALSDRELYVARYGRRFPSVDGQYAFWLGGRAHYMIHFARKWLMPTYGHHYRVDYRRLIEAPDGVIRNLLRFCGMTCDDDAIRRAIQERAPLRDNPVAGTQDWATGPYRRRSVSDSAFCDRKLLAEFESIVAEAAPILTETRYFPTVDTAESLIAFVQHCHLAQAGHPPSRLQIEALKRRLPSFAQCGHAHFALSRVLRAAGDLDGAILMLNRALDLGVIDTEAFIEASELRRASGDRAAAWHYAEKVLEAHPGIPSHEVFAGIMSLEAGRVGDALTHAMHAIELGLTQPRLLDSCITILQAARAQGYRLEIGIHPPSAAKLSHAEAISCRGDPIPAP